MGRDLELATKLRDHRLRVVEVAGWQSRGSSRFRPRGSVTHHTAGPLRGNAPSLGVVIGGRRGLPGPLANVLQARDNTIYLVAAGRANHAGTGGWRGLVGNSSVYGNEVENAGYATGQRAEPWRDDQVETMARVAAAFAEGNHSPVMACFHKEWAPRRKIDPHSLDGAAFRVDVARLLGAPRAPSPVSKPLGVIDMFLAIDGYGLFAIIDGLPVAFRDLKEFGAAKNASPGVPMMTLPRPMGEHMVTELIRKHAKSVA